MSYDIKFRQRTIEYLQSGHSYRETAKLFGISPCTLNNWEKKYSATGSLKDLPPKRTFKKIDPNKLSAYISENPDAYQSGIAKHFNCTQQSIFTALKRLGITRKKRRNDIGSKTLSR